jgi:Phosphotransferase enzyme family
LSAIELAAETQIAVATRLAGEPVLRMFRVGGGRNSRIFRVETGNRVFALKQYPSIADDPRDRLGVETRALAWMAKHQLDMVPRVVATDAANNSALLSWAEGSLVRSVGGSDMDQAIAFLGALAGLDAVDFPPTHLASEACLSGAEIERQLRARTGALRALEGEPELRLFLTGEFAGALEQCLSSAREAFASAGLAFERDLSTARRRLVPSDFGFHNALRDDAGRLTFIDFEYFGWDDPVKLTADVLLHPGTPVASELRSRFRTAAEQLYGGDPDFAIRLAALHPLFGLRWVLILLNEFHPERWRRRVLAGASAGWAEAKDRQLGAARAMLATSRALGGPE